MALFLAEASLIQSFVPFFRLTLAQEAMASNHYAQLDGLRGILALSVFFTHTMSHHQLWTSGVWELPQSNFYSQMAVAPVAMFFLITGFLFWSKALRGVRNWRVFFWHRIRRLVPAYLFALLLIGIVVGDLTHFQLHTSRVSLFRSVLFYLSFCMVPGPAPNGLGDASLIYANVFWSIRVEWMFYLAFPLMALFARTKVKQLVLLLIAVALYFTLPAFREHMRLRDGLGTLGLGTVQYFDFFLLSYFSIGMIAAVLKKNLPLKGIARNPATTVVAIGALIALLLFVPARPGLLEGVILGIPFLLVVLGNSFFGLLNLRPLGLLGKISYSTYLLHGIVLFVANRIAAQNVDMATISPVMFWAFTAMTGVVVVLLAAFSYRYIEAPCMTIS